MATSIDAVLTSLEGYSEDERGDVSGSAPHQVVHSYSNELAAALVRRP